MLYVAAAIVGAVLVLGVGYVLGQRGASVDEAALVAAVAERDEFEQTVADLSRQLADQRLSETIETGANEELRVTIKTLNDQIGVLEEEVRFYKRLMAPSEDQRGLRIEQLTVERTPEPSQVAYSLLLTQIVDRRTWIQGKVSMEVIGEQDGVPQVLPLTDLASQETYPFKFRFRYFQDFTGAMTIPVGFEPKSILVTAQTGSARLQRTFEWDVQEG